MKLFLVVVWRTKELGNGSMKRVETVKVNSALREVEASDAQKARDKVIASLGSEYDAEMMEVEVACPFGE